ncbi:MAG: hypothetical protein J6B16_00130 [Clostridia bacterium]|nr:hypothetical protein [Clostridia bacterium]
MLKLYGDGIHDDTLAIQELLDGGTGVVILPEPEKFYLISKPLEISSNTTLKLPRYATIRLKDGSNCVMLTNKKTPCKKRRLDDSHATRFFNFINSYVDDYSPEAICENITVEGGIWDANNLNQQPNPIQTRDESIKEYFGYTMLFYAVKNLNITSLTYKDVINYCVCMDYVDGFTVNNITFDFNGGNPHRINMDGIHLNGNCHNGVITNLQGACFDDLVALNAEEGSRGPITNIKINGIYAEGCHSAVRFLTVNQAVKNITVENVYGTFYQYCIGFSKHYKGETTGYYENINIKNLFATKAYRHPYLYKWFDSYVYPYVWIADEINIHDLTIDGIRRMEWNNNVCTIYVGKDSCVNKFTINDAVTENFTSHPMPFIVNDGTIKLIKLSNVAVKGDEVLINNNVINSLIM